MSSSADKSGGAPARGPRLLERIDGPADVQVLSEEELAQLAQEVREHIIDTVGEIGGHFGANLGTCELAVALHSLLDSPRDKILWDVGHQAYPHKILTGRRTQLHTIRQYGGLAPFCSMAESPHDIMGAGHASTSVGYAVGIKEGMRHLDDKAANGKVVAVIGDGAMTGGVAFEAIGQAGGLGTPMVVVLNDNGMSIAPNVGALSRYFNRVRLNPKLWHARSGVEGGLARLPGSIGAAFERLGPQLKESIKAFWAPGLWWEELDWAYMGVIDGHDVRALRVALREALAAERPVVVHIATVKGKGFAPAEDGGLEGMERWHAAKPKSILNGVPTPAPVSPPVPSPSLSNGKPVADGAQGARAPQYTQVFGEALVRECERDERVVGITAAMNSGTGLNILQKALPERYFDVGIAEQQAILFAAGLALQGVKPVAAIYSTFLQRAFDQIVHDVCLQNLNVVFAMDRAGLVGDDGPTHHGAFDIAYLRCLPNMVLMAPRDEAMLVHMLRTALCHDGPIALRYPRGEGIGVGLPSEPQPIAIGSGEILREGGAAGPVGRRVALIGYGSGVGKAQVAADLLAEDDIALTVVDARFAKPIDAGLMAQLAAEHDLLVTIEEGVLAGGFGSAVWEALNEAGVAPPRILRVGLPDRYVTHGKPTLLHEEVGFTGERIAERVRAAINDRRSASVGILNETARWGGGPFRGEEGCCCTSGREESCTRGTHVCVTSITEYRILRRNRTCVGSGKVSGVARIDPTHELGGACAQSGYRFCDRDADPTIYSMKSHKQRLDTLLTERGLFPSRSRAAASVMAGEVSVGSDGRRAAKPGELVAIDALLNVRERPAFVSRGGIKLANALAGVDIHVLDRKVLDVGASTGGFTDCLLQRGAARAIAVDVGYGDLDYRLRTDPRVTVLERTNARSLSRESLPYIPDIAVVDVSFISLRKVLPAVLGCLADRHDALALIKPQFEVGRERVGKGGVVRHAEHRREALIDVGTAALELGASVLGYRSSGLPGPKGNLETFIWLAEPGREGSVVDAGELERMAREVEP